MSFYTYSVRRLFSQGVRNDALKRFQTPPLVNIFGNGGLPSRMWGFQGPGVAVMNSSLVQQSIYGPGVPAASTTLTHLSNPNNASAGM